jgi:hypothetical protein
MASRGSHGHCCGNRFRCSKDTKQQSDQDEMERPAKSLRHALGIGQAVGATGTAWLLL